MKNILVTGSLAFDYIMDFPGIFTEHINPQALHNINVSFLIDKLKRGFGGTAGNIAYTLSLLKTKSLILGAVGQDFNDYKYFLSKYDIDTTQIKVIPDEFTSQAYVMTDKKDNQISAFYPGAMNYNHTLSIEQIEPKPDFVLITPCGTKAFVKYVSECKKLGIPYLYDPSQQITGLANEEILKGGKGAKIFINNDYEYEMIKKRLSFSDSDFLKHIEILIITKGQQGSIIKTKDKTITIKTATPKEILDPTGAGDAYRSGFVAGYVRGFDLKVCGQMGSVAAAYSIEQYGTQNHSFTISEFKNRYSQAFSEVVKL